MKQTTETVVFIMLAVAGSFASANALPSLWSEYYRNALYSRNSVARSQQSGPQCLAGEAPAGISCQSARLTTGTRNTFVHVCPGDPDDNGAREICYNSKFARCCRFAVESGVLKCVSATKLTVGGQQVTVGIYELGTNPGHCIYFQSASIRSCCLAADKELECRTSPVTTPPPTPPPCVPKRDVYFVLDATQSIESQIFCTFGYVIQLIEAAINPSGGTDGARVAVILFENQFFNISTSRTVRYNTAHLFDLSDSCNTAVKTNIPRVVYEYRGVEKGQLLHGRDNLDYPQVYAKSTLPYSALSLALSDINTKSKTQSRPATVIILTDGEPDQTISGIINQLRSNTADLIAAGIGSANDINQANLETMASSPADAIYEPDLKKVVSFAKRIVQRMRDTAALCLDQAQRILDTLDKANITNINQYCSRCMFEEIPSDMCKTKEFPQCGAQNLQMQAFDESDYESAKLDSNALSSEELRKLILEERILAEVEEIMERGGRRKQQQHKEDAIFLTAA